MRTNSGVAWKAHYQVLCASYIVNNIVGIWTINVAEIGRYLGLVGALFFNTLVVTPGIDDSIDIIAI